jgi:hypothetical protein
MSEEQPHDSQTAKHKDSEISETQERTGFYFPFRWLEHILRNTVRLDAQQSGNRDYNNPGDADLVAAFRRGRRCWAKLWSGVTAEGVIALFTIVLTVVTYVQWKAMRDQNDIMREEIAQNREQSRATITTVSPTISELKIGEPIRSRVNIVNAGQRRGTLTFLEGDVESLPTGQSPRVLLDALRAKIGRIGARRNLAEPTQPIAFHSVPTGNLTESAKSLIDIRVSTLHWAIVAQYTDGFGKVRTVGFCFFYNVDTKEWFSHGELGYVEWDEQEQTDEQ